MLNLINIEVISIVVYRQSVEKVLNQSRNRHFHNPLYAKKGYFMPKKG